MGHPRLLSYGWSGVIKLSVVVRASGEIGKKLEVLGEIISVRVKMDGPPGQFPKRRRKPREAEMAFLLSNESVSGYPLLALCATRAV